MGIAKGKIGNEGVAVIWMVGKDTMEIGMILATCKLKRNRVHRVLLN